MIKISERDLEDILYDRIKSNAGILELKRRGLDISPTDFFRLYRQLNLKDYGIADLVRVAFKGRHVEVSIIELKVSDFCIEHLQQLGRYITAIGNIMYDGIMPDYKYSIGGILIVNGFDSKREYAWLDKIISRDISVYSMEYAIDGLKFNKVLPAGWHMSGASHEVCDYVDINELKQLYKASFRKSLREDLIDDLPF